MKAEMPEESASVERQVGKPAVATEEPEVTELLELPELPPQRWPRSLRVMLLVLVDGLAMLMAGVAAYYLWALPVRGQRPDLYLELLPLLPMFLLANAVWGLYPGFGAGAVESLRRLSLSSSLIFLSLAAISFAFKLDPVYSRMTFAVAWLLTLILLPLARFALLSLAQRWSWWGEPCVVVGTGALAEQTVEALRSALSLGYRPIAALHVGDEGPTRVAGIPVVGNLDSHPELIDRRVRVLLVADTGLTDRNEKIDQLRHDFRHVIVIRDHEALPVDGLEVRNLGGVIGVEFVNQLQRRRNRVVKRTLDIVLGGALLLLTAKLWLLSALLIRLTSRGPALYFQEREGLFGRPFKLIKLRTMYVDAEAR